MRCCLSLFARLDSSADSTQSHEGTACRRYLHTCMLLSFRLDWTLGTFPSSPSSCTLAPSQLVCQRHSRLFEPSRLFLLPPLHREKLRFFPCTQMAHRCHMDLSGERSMDPTFPVDEQGSETKCFKVAGEVCYSVRQDCECALERWR